MKHFSRPYWKFHSLLGCAALAAAGAVFTVAPPAAQAGQMARIVADSNPPLSSASPQGYLGVDVTDVDAAKAQALKLKEARGAVITLIDHDAPAGKIGLKVNDVVLELNGQTVENADQLRKMLREMPPGRKVSLEISHAGNIQTLTVQLADRRVIEKDAWARIDDAGDSLPPPPRMGMLAGGSGGYAPAPGRFHFPFFGGSLNVGALVEPLTSQMAQYLGVRGGLIVRQVARKSEAAVAGLRAFDVILKVGPESITTLADWSRALRSNQGKPVQVTILRNKKQQMVTLKVDSKHRGAVGNRDFPAADKGGQLAGLGPAFDPASDPDFGPDFARSLSAPASL
jgi:serine protease Do